MSKFLRMYLPAQSNRRDESEDEAAPGGGADRPNRSSASGGTLEPDRIPTDTNRSRAAAPKTTSKTARCVADFCPFDWASTGRLSSISNEPSEIGSYFPLLDDIIVTYTPNQ